MTHTVKAPSICVRIQKMILALIQILTKSTIFECILMQHNEQRAVKNKEIACAIVDFDDFQLF